MRDDLVERREAARDRHDAVLAAGMAPGDPKLRAELMAVLAELEQVHLETDEATAAPDEVARIYSYMADVLFDIGGRSDTQYLGRGLRLYDRALKLIDGGVPQRSKLLFNRANTLRGLSGGDDRRLLLQAREGYAEALAGFEGNAPAFAPAAREALGIVDRQLAAVDRLEAMRRRQQEMRTHMFQRLLSIAWGTASAANPQELLVAMLYRRYRKDVDAEKVFPDRRPILDGLFADLSLLTAGSDQSVEALQQRMERMHTLFLRINELLGSAPSASIATSRRDAVWRELEQTRTGLLAQTMRRFKYRRDTDRGQELMQRLLIAINDVQRAADDDAVAVLERDVLRELSLEIREFTRRNHLTLARPVWSTEDVVRCTGAVFFSGGASARARLEAVTRARGLEVLAAPMDGMDPAESRWRQLRAANVAVFDFTPEASDPATTSYELGIARALGVETLILAQQRLPLPFDIEVDPVLDDKNLGAAIDRALYRPLIAETGDSVATFIASVTGAVAGTLQPEGRFVLDQLSAGPPDATRAADLFAQLRGAQRLPFLLLRPAWASPPLARTERRCFHVTPFGPDWAGPARDAVAQSCREKRVTYVRGDIASDARIIHSIWNEICQATHVVVDLTGLNLNVLVELGIAHTLGRACLIVAQTGPDVAPKLLPSLAKFRVTPYRTGQAISSLSEAVSAFIG